MSRWFWKRAVLAAVMGTGLAASAPAAEPRPGGYQPNDVLVIRSPGKPDQKMTVIRSVRRSDGRVYTEVKDAAGQVFTMIDQQPHGAVDRVPEVMPAGAKDYVLPRAKPREYEVPPLNGVSSMSGATKAWTSTAATSATSSTAAGAMPSTSPTAVPPDNAVAAADAKRWRIFGKSEKSDPPPAPAPSSSQSGDKKPGLWSRMFNKNKSETPPSMTPQPQAYAPPAPSYTPPPGTAYPPPAFSPATPMQAPTPAPLPSGFPTNPAVPGVPAQMPAGQGGTELAPWNQMRTPTPAPGIATPAPTPAPPLIKAPVPAVTTGTTRINLTPEPPTVKAPAVTAPAAPPVTAPSVPPVTAPGAPGFVPGSPVVAPLPPVPTSRPMPVTVPSVPPVTTPPVTTPPVTVPAFPVPSPNSIPAPTQQSKGKSPAEQIADEMIRTISMTATVSEGSPLAELKPHVATLQKGPSATERQAAAQILGGGRYASRPEVKAILFEAARNDTAPAVRACCIQQLGDLGYYDPAFMHFLAECSTDESGAVREAAAKAVAKLKPAR